MHPHQDTTVMFTIKSKNTFLNKTVEKNLDIKNNRNQN